MSASWSRLSGGQRGPWWGVKESIYIAATMTLVEIAGLSIVIFGNDEALSFLPAHIEEM